jgi:hypothetical protein
MIRLGNLVVLADHAAADGGTGGPVPVVMVGVLAGDRLQVPFVVDKRPVGAGDAGASDGEPIVRSDCVAGFAGHDCDTQS